MICSTPKRKNAIMQFSAKTPRLIIDKTVQVTLCEDCFYIDQFKVDLSLMNKISLLHNNDGKVYGFTYKKKFKDRQITTNDPLLQAFITLIDSRISYSSVNRAYHPIRIIGRGTTSQVLIVEEVHSSQEFASKSILKTYLDQDPIRFASFRQEVRILREISKNPHLMKLHRVYDSKAAFYMILDYVPGKTLQQLIEKRSRENQRFSYDQVLQIVKMILVQLVELHGMGIMHRDLKPGNIIVEEDLSNLKIIDFGFAQKVKDPKLFKRCGTAGFVAPEIFITENYNQQCDMFSVGCIAYRLLTGVQLFLGKDNEDIMRSNRYFTEFMDHTYMHPMARHFLKGLLRFQPETRLTSEEALSHVIFNGDLTDRQNFEDIEERDDQQSLPDFESPDLIQKIQRSQKTILSYTSFYQKEDGLEKVLV